MKKLLLIAFLVHTATLAALATAQIPDKIMVDGTEYMLYSNPLETYFRNNPDKRPSDGVQSTGLWRGYVATFEVRNGQLLVRDIEIQIEVNSKQERFGWKSVLKQVFPTQDAIKVDWFTGLLVLPYGKRVNYVHMGYGSTYENYLLLEIDKGDFKRKEAFTTTEYEQFKEKQFQQFKRTPEYAKQMKELKKEGSTEEFIESFLRNFITEYSSKILTNK